MQCNNCKSDIPSNTNFCPNCGTTVEQPINNNINQPVYNQNYNTQPMYNQNTNMNNYPNNQVPNYYNVPVQKKNNNTRNALIIGGVIIGAFIFMAVIFFVLPFIMIAKDIEEDRSNINDIKSNIESNYNDYYSSNSNSNNLDDTLNSLSAWNKYSSVRNSNIPSYIKDINGNWLSLSTSDTYWVFENNTFYWYKSKSDLTDNYWYGTTNIYTGLEGFKQVGLAESKMNQVIAQSNGKLTANDFKAVICTPTKLIVNGQDKSSTITTGSVKKILWILVDHGTEGIEGQYLDISTGETAYYFKVAK